MLVLLWCLKQALVPPCGPPHSGKDFRGLSALGSCSHNFLLPKFLKPLSTQLDPHGVKLDIGAHSTRHVLCSLVSRVDL